MGFTHQGTFSREMEVGKNPTYVQISELQVQRIQSRPRIFHTNALCPSLSIGNTNGSNKP